MRIISSCPKTGRVIGINNFQLYRNIREQVQKRSSR
jgi:hypothetical protein